MEAQYGSRIRQMRIDKGLTQIELAAKAGIAVNSLRRYEANDRQPTLETIEKLATALKMTTADFLWSDPKPVPNYYWSADLDDKLKPLGCSIGFYEEDASLWINYPDGTLEVSITELQDLNESANSFVKFKLEELKQKHLDRFRPSPEEKPTEDK